MAQSDQGLPIVRRTEGFTLIEVLIGVLLVTFAASAVATLFRHAEYTAIKARIEGRIAALSRYHSMRMLNLPYNRLSDPSSGVAFSETGFLYHPSDGSGYANLYPYSVHTTVSAEGNGNLRISTSIEWEEPSPDFSSPTPLQKQIDLGSHVRRRF